MIYFSSTNRAFDLHDFSAWKFLFLCRSMLSNNKMPESYRFVLYK